MYTKFCKSLVIKQNVLYKNIDKNVIKLLFKTINKTHLFINSSLKNIQQNPIYSKISSNPQNIIYTH